MLKKSWALWVAAMWWCSLLTVGLLVVPLLFQVLPTPALAGDMAAQLFAAQTWLSLACGFILLFWCLKKPLPLSSIDYIAIVLIVFGVLSAAVVQWLIAPRIVLRHDLALWHGLGTAGMAVHALCAIGVFSRVVRSCVPVKTSAAV